jgi:hypothetical protein
MCMFCRSLFALLYFFFWPLCCVFFSDIRTLITPMVSSNSSWECYYIIICRFACVIFVFLIPSCVCMCVCLFECPTAFIMSSILTHMPFTYLWKSKYILYQRFYSNHQLPVYILMTHRQTWMLYILRIVNCSQSLLIVSITRIFLEQSECEY